MTIKNPTIQKAIQVATIGGAAILALKSAQTLMAIKSPKAAAMPIVSILVAAAAFNYAVRTSPTLVVKSNS
tara:strand:+ start:137 stop:349 length:213 start_codon:yes stop_codon:yes gene_type:complete